MLKKIGVALIALLLVPALLIAAAVPLWSQQQRRDMKIESSAFAPGQPIPQKYTCEGTDVSPAFRWSGAPAGTKTFALIADDPDAPARTWVHWVLFNLPAATQLLPEAVPKTESAAGGVQGRNDFGKIGYGGPCPPPGHPHRYFFKLYALDSELLLTSSATKKDVDGAMQGHVLAQAELMGTYQRRR
jgi:hypothetical protein